VAANRPLEVRWVRRARRQVLSIQEYVEKRNPAAAKRIGAAIRAAVRLLEVLPNSGRPGSLKGTRDWVVRGLPYIIVYEVREGPGRIAHSRRFPSGAEASDRPSDVICGRPSSPDAALDLALGPCS
jgi:plasmid stabilization system protein ParE